MYYYSHHIGDFIKETSRLNDSQCMAYLRLLWKYYDTEEPFSNDIESLAFEIGYSICDVTLILKHYFVLDGDRWVHDRCERVIAEYRSRADKARNSANARWSNANALRTQSERNADESLLDANQEPITDNQKPILNTLDSPQAATQGRPAKKTKAKAAELDYSVWPEMPTPKILKDWIDLRKSKRAKISQTVLDDFGNEFRKAKSFGYSVDDCLTKAISRGWSGFEFEWMQNQQARASPPAYGNPGPLMPPGVRSTRDVTLIENIQDRSWAD
jgi:uncharacterized protein YdaU (DUF1376 family)